MITSIFNKSKPINFVIVFLIMVLAFITARTGIVNIEISPAFIFKQVITFALCVITILLFDFIITKNSLSKKNSYEILLFSLFYLILFQTTNDLNILFANFFVLLGLRRIISLRSQKDTKSKLFDGAFWIAVATICYFWAILFFIVIILSLVLYTNNNLRHWIMPFLGIATVFIIAMGVSIVFYGDFFEISKETHNLSFDFSPYNSTQYIIAITVLLSFGIWASIFYLQNIKKKKKDARASFKIVIITAVIAFLIALLAPEKDGSEFLFLFAPLAIIIANYIETIQEKWFKEVFLFALILTPFLLLLL